MNHLILILKDMSSQFLLLLSLLALSQVHSSILPTKQGIRTLVLLDSWATIETHSIFFDTLRRDGGHTLHFEMASTAPQIKYYQEYFYDNIILMAPSVRDLKSPNSEKDLIDFVEANHNIMIFGDIDSRKAIRSLFNDFGADLENVVNTCFLLLTLLGILIA
jgi:hypothetical protein